MITVLILSLCIEIFFFFPAIDQTFFECDKHIWRLGPRKLPSGIDIRGGSNWVVLNKEFVSYIVNGNDTFINGLRTLYNYTLVPAESFFHTALRNSKFCQSLHKNNLRVENWKKHLGCKSRYAAVMDWKIVLTTKIKVLSLI